MALSVYSVDSTLPTFYERGQQLVVTLPVYAGGGGQVPTAPDSGTFTLYDASKVEIINARVVTIGGDFTPTVTVAAADIPTTLALSDMWQEEWMLTWGAHTEVFRRDAYLCLRLLHPTVTEPMLVRRISDLANFKAPNVSDFSGYITEAWGIVSRTLLQSGKRPYLVMNDWSLTDWHYALTAELIFRDASTYMSEGRYTERADAYKADAVLAYDRLKLEYDLTEANQRGSATPSVAARPVIYGNFTPAMSFRAWGRR